MNNHIQGQEAVQTDTTTIRVLIADDHAVVRDSVAMALSDEVDIEVIARAGNGRQALVLAAEHNPDVVLLDVVMPELNGLEAARQLRAANQSVKIICLTMLRERQTLQDMLEAGCNGFVLKHSPLSELAGAVRAVYAGNRYIDPNAVQHEVKAPSQPQNAVKNRRLGNILSSRERQVLQLIASGKTSQQVSEDMFISINTVTKHRQNIARKLGINSVSGLIRYALNEGIADI